MFVRKCAFLSEEFALFRATFDFSLKRNRHVAEWQKKCKRAAQTRGANAQSWVSLSRGPFPRVVFSLFFGDWVANFWCRRLHRVLRRRSRVSPATPGTVFRNKHAASFRYFDKISKKLKLFLEKSSAKIKKPESLQRFSLAIVSNFVHNCEQICGCNCKQVLYFCEQYTQQRKIKKEDRKLSVFFLFRR